MTNDTAARPFLGPRPFQTGETLYGRDYEARALLSMLIAERIVLLHSPSGAGKTSLVQAALIPLLEERGFTVLPTVRVGQEPPAGWAGNRYSCAALLALEERLPPEEQRPLGELASLSLGDYLARRVPEGADTVLVIDQFEEVLTRDPTDAAAKRAFFRALGEALRAPRLWALFVIREEYVAALEPYAQAIPTRLAAHFRLDLLPVEGALAALREPLRRRGVDLPADQALRLIDDLRRVNVQQADGSIVAQLGPSVEPVQLQVVGLRLWERTFERGRAGEGETGRPGDRETGRPGDRETGSAGASARPTITAADIDALGDVGSALGDYYAERVAAIARESGVSERLLRGWFERELITPQGVRGQVLQGVDASGGLPNAAIAGLIDAYLVRAEPRRGATWYELAHDRLIAPVRAGNAAWFTANLSTLQRQAELWAQQGRPPGLLLRGEALREAEQWAETNSGELTEAEREFLSRSQEAHAVRERERRQGRRIRNLWIGAGALVIAAAVAGALAYWNQRRADQEYREGQARLLAANAVSNLPLDPQRSLLLARAGVIMTRTADETVVPEAEQALQQAAQSSRVHQIVPVSERGLQELDTSVDGATIATSGDDGVVRLFDLVGAERLAIQAGDPRLDQPALGLAVSPAGDRVAASVGSAVRVWDVPGGAQLLTLTGHGDDVLAIAFSPDGATLASAGADGRVILWDAASGERLRTLDLGEVAVYAAAFSPDGAALATGDTDGQAIIWSVADGAPLLTLEGHLDTVLDVAWDPRGELIATASQDLTVRLWDIASGELLDLLRGHTGNVEHVGFSREGDLLVSASQDGTARLWAVADGRPVLTLAGHTSTVSGAVFGPYGDELITAGMDGTLRSWDLDLAPAGGTYVVDYSPDGATLATAGADGATLWDAASGERLLDIPAEDEISALAWAPDGAALATGDVRGLIQLVDPAGGAEPRPLVGHQDIVNRMAFSPDGRVLASVSSDRSVRLWEVETGVERLSYDEHFGEVSVVAWSPDGSLVASGDVLGKIILWDPSTGAERMRLNLGSRDIVQGLAFSPDGRSLAAADEMGLLAVWDMPGGAERARRPTGVAIRDLAYRPDGAELATIAADRTVRRWGAADLAPGPTLPLAAEGYSLDYSPGGRTLAAADAGGQAQLFPLYLDDLLALAERRTVRGPTPEECDTYPLTEGCPTAQP